MFHVEHYSPSYGYKILFFVQFSALLFTFSKAAISGFFFGFIIAILNIHKMFHVEQIDEIISNVPRGTLNTIGIDSVKKCSTWNIRKIFIFTGSFFIQLLVCYWSFQRQQLFVWFIITIYCIITMFHVEQIA